MDKKTFKLLAALFVTIIVVWAAAGTYQSCKGGETIAKIKADLRVAKADAEIAWGRYNDLKKTSDIEIARLSSIVESSELVITDLTGDLSERDKNIAHLEEALASIPNVDTIDNLTKRVDLLTGLVDEWKEKFTLAEAIISQKDTQIFALSAKYDLEHIAHLQLQSAYTGLYEYNQGLVRFNTELKRAWSRNKFWGSVKTGGLIAAGAVIIYSILKGNQ